MNGLKSVWDNTVGAAYDYVAPRFTPNVGAVTDYVGARFTPNLSAVGTVINNTVNSIGRDPIGTLLPAAVSVVSGGTIPPYVTASAIAASRDQNIGQIASTALISYGAQNLASTEFGVDTGYANVDPNYVAATGTSLNDLTSQIAGSIGGGAATQAMVTSGLNNATFNGLLAIAQGKPVSEAVGKGFVGGALGSGVNQLTNSGLSYFTDKQGGAWGFTGDQLKLVQGGINTGLVAGVSGQDIGTAINAYVARAAQSAAGGKLGEFVKTAVQDAKDAITAYNPKEATFESDKAAVDAKKVLFDNTYAVVAPTINELKDFQNSNKDFVDQFNDVIPKYQSSLTKVINIPGYTGSEGVQAKYIFEDIGDLQKQVQSYVDNANSATSQFAYDTYVQAANVNIDVLKKYQSALEQQAPDLIKGINWANSQDQNQLNNYTNLLNKTSDQSFQNNLQAVNDVVTGKDIKNPYFPENPVVEQNGLIPLSKTIVNSLNNEALYSAWKSGDIEKYNQIIDDLRVQNGNLPNSATYIKYLNMPGGISRYYEDLNAYNSYKQLHPNEPEYTHVSGLSELQNKAQTSFDAAAALDPSNKIAQANAAKSKYETAVAEAAIRDFTIDQINTGALKPTGYDSKTGTFDFGNGLTYDGKDFYQNGERQFSNAIDISAAPVKTNQVISQYNIDNPTSPLPATDTTAIGPLSTDAGQPAKIDTATSAANPETQSPLPTTDVTAVPSGGLENTVQIQDKDRESALNAVLVLSQAYARHGGNADALRSGAMPSYYDGSASLAAENIDMMLPIYRANLDRAIQSAKTYGITDEQISSITQKGEAAGAQDVQQIISDARNQYDATMGNTGGGLLGQVINAGSNIVHDVGTAIATNPILNTAAGALLIANGVPPEAAVALLQANKGASPEQILKSAALAGLVSGVAGTVGQGVTQDLLQQAAESGDVANLAAAQTAGQVAGSAAGALTGAAVTGGDPGKALTNSLLSSGFNIGTRDLTAEIPGYNDLPDAAKKSVNAAIVAAVQGKDPTTAALNQAIKAGVNEAVDQAKIAYNTAGLKDFVEEPPTSPLPATNTAEASTGNLPTEAAAVETTSPLPATDQTPSASGLQLAAADTGTASDVGTSYRVEGAGAPIYANDALGRTAPSIFGYDLMPASLADDRPEGSFYSAENNAWYMPNKDVQALNEAIVGGDEDQPAEVVEAPPVLPESSQDQQPSSGQDNIVSALPSISDVGIQPSTEFKGLPSTATTDTSGETTNITSGLPTTQPVVETTSSAQPSIVEQPPAVTPPLSTTDTTAPSTGTVVSVNPNESTAVVVTDSGETKVVPADPTTQPGDTVYVPTDSTKPTDVPSGSGGGNEVVSDGSTTTEGGDQIVTGGGQTGDQTTIDTGNQNTQGGGTGVNNGDGTTTYTGDDGSTITIDHNGNVVDYTDGTNITDITGGGGDQVTTGGGGGGDTTTEEPVCAEGYHWDAAAQMCMPDEDQPPASQECPDGYVFDMVSQSCVPVQTTTPTPTPKPTPTPRPTTTPAAPTTTALSNQISGLQSLMNQKTLDSSPQMLKGATGAGQTAKLAQLHQLFNSLTPEMRSVLSERGVAPAQEEQPMEMAADGGSINETSKYFDSLMPKYVKAPVQLEAAPAVEIKSRLGALRHLGEGVLKGPKLVGGLAHGGLPQKYAEAAPEGHNPEFITGLTGYYATGRGTGQSDDIPAMLHDGDYVIDADAVAALGDGSSKAGAEALANFQSKVPHHMSEGGEAVPAKIADGEYVFPEAFVTALGNGDNKRGAKLLDAMRQELREHKRSAPTSKIPPKAKSPLDYLKMAKG